MFAFNNISSLALLASLYSIAAASSAHVNLYANDVCNGAVDTFDVAGAGAYRCVAVSNKRSISASGSGCTIKTWSGNNCRGSTVTIRQGDGCHSILYGSVSASCS